MIETAIVPFGEITLDRVNITSRALIFPEDLSEKEWENFGKRIDLIIDAGPFIIGDWVNWGISHYGATMKTIRGILTKHLGHDNKITKSRSDKTLFNYAALASKIPPSIRVEDVPYSTHETVAKLCPKKFSNKDHEDAIHGEMHKWLVLAREKELSRNDVRHAIANRAQIEEYTKSTVEEEPTQTAPQTAQETAFAALAIGAQRELNRLINWFEEEGDIKEWSEERKEAVKKQLRATIESADKLTDKFILLCQ